MNEEILVVDDERSVCNSVKDVLEMQGYSVTTVPDGETALERINDQDFDLVLLDLKMPGLSGMDVLRRIWRRAPETKIIILTGHASLDTAVEALRKGVSDYIRKPMNAEDITAAVGRALAEKVEKRRKEVLIEQMETSLTQLKDVEGITTEAVPPRRVITLPAGIMADLERRELWRGGKRVELTPTEGILFSVFLENQGQVITHREIVYKVHGYEVSEDEAPEVLRPIISRLRKKLSRFPGMEAWIENIRGTGYVFNPK